MSAQVDALVRQDMRRDELQRRLDGLMDMVKANGAFSRAWLFRTGARGIAARPGSGVTMAMNMHNLGWRASARLRYGLHWRRHAPTLHDYPHALPSILLALLVLILWFWMMDRDYAEEQRVAAAVAQQEAEHATALMIHCMNGRAVWLSADKREAVVCEKAWSMPI